MNRGLLFTAGDRCRLGRLLLSDDARSMAPWHLLDELEWQLETATAVQPESIPEDVVTMNSTVRLVNVKSAKEIVCTVVYPEDVELVKCRTVDLEVPAWAEIILEGEIPPKVRETEGPFSEFQDYYLTGSGMNPIVNIKAVTMRNDAIFKNVQNGTEVEGCVYHKVPMSAQILRRARTVGGLADVKNVLVMPGIFGVVVQMKPRYYGEARNVLMSVLSSEYQHPKVAIAVDETHLDHHIPCSRAAARIAAAACSNSSIVV